MNLILRTLSIVSMLTGVLALIFLVAKFTAVEQMLVAYFVRDGEIESADRLYIALFTGPVYLLVFGFVLGQLARMEVFSGAKAPWQMGPSFLRPSLIATIIYFSLGSLLVLQYVLGCHMRTPFSAALCAPYEKEGFYELLTGYGFLLAQAPWLVFATSHCWSQAKRNSPFSAKFQAYLLGLAALACLFVGMEEISWGQTYLGWDTPDYVARVNVQKETNLHNLFNQYFAIGNIIGGSVIFLSCFATFWLAARGWASAQWRILFPNPNLIGLAAWFPLAAAVDGEPLEFLATVFLFCYCRDLYRQLKFYSELGVGETAGNRMPSEYKTKCLSIITSGIIGWAFYVTQRNCAVVKQLVRYGCCSLRWVLPAGRVGPW